MLYLDLICLNHSAIRKKFLLNDMTGSYKRLRPIMNEKDL